MSFVAKFKELYLLIISEDLDVADVLEEVLNESGYRTDKAYSLIEAKALGTDAEFDLVIIDGDILEKNYEAFQHLLEDGLFLGNVKWLTNPMK